MTYEPNTWVNFDGYVSLVMGVWQGYYEPFDAEVVDGKIRCGERRYRQLVLRDLFDNHGRRLAGVPAMKCLETIAEDLNPAGEEDMRRIERFPYRHSGHEAYKTGDRIRIHTGGPLLCLTHEQECIPG